MVSEIFHGVAPAGARTRAGLAIADGAVVGDEAEHGLLECWCGVADNGQEDLDLAQDHEQPWCECRVVSQAVLIDGDQA